METSKIHQLVIRLAVEEDLAQASAIWHERVSLLQQSDHFQQSKPARIPEWQRQARSWLNSDQCGFFVGDVNEVVSGYMVVMISSGPAGLEPVFVGKVIDLAIDLHESHSGLVGALLDEASQWLRSRGIDFLAVDVPARYPVEEAFWRAQGARLRFNQNWLAL